MNENGEDFVPRFEDEDTPVAAPTQPTSAPMEPKPGTQAAVNAGALPEQEPTREHEPTSVLPSSESAPVYTPPPPARKAGRAAQPVPGLLIVLLLVFVCLVSVFLVIGSGVLGDTLPPEVAQLADFLTPAKGVAVTSSPTVTRTPLGPSSFKTATPAVAVTVFPTATGQPTAPEPTRTASPAPTKVPPAQPALPTPVPTLAAATLTPESFQPAHEVTRAGVIMVSIPGGAFSMGSDAFAPEKPIHVITLAAFYIDKHEVTNASWAACVAAGGCNLPGSTDGYDGQPYYGVEAHNNYPVIFVSWFNADSYCRWRGARLPTEAEWEMAARWNPATGAVTTYPWGDQWNQANLNYCDSSCLNTDRRFKDNTFNDNWPQMAPVGTFVADVSPTGVVDMAGNVAEWVADWYGSLYYSESPAENPSGPASGVDKVIRGGGWSLNQVWSRSTARNHFGPLTQAAGVGFRCAANP